MSEAKISHFLKEHWRTILIGVGFVIAGITLSILQVRLEKRVAEPFPLQPYFVILLDHTAVALFSVAVLGILLEVPHFYSYFHKLILAAITHKEHLKQLSPAEKERAQKAALEAFFDIEDLAKEPGFYEFYLQRMKTHIFRPFREQTTATTTVEVKDEQHFRAKDHIEYTCRSLQKEIQDFAGWTAEMNEMDAVTEFQMIITWPNGESMTFTPDDPPDREPPRLEAEIKGRGHKLWFKEYPKYHQCDKLKIQIDVTYEVPVERPFSWTMPCLSNSFTGAIICPKQFEIFFDRFGLEEEAFKKEKQQEDQTWLYPFEHKSWLLPDDGFAFHLRKRKE